MKCDGRRSVEEGKLKRQHSVMTGLEGSMIGIAQFLPCDAILGEAG